MDLLTEEHAMPSVEAVLTGTLALMTGYSQFLQAALNPAHRLGMGEKITHNLALLSDHPMLSPACREVLHQLQQRWAVLHQLQQRWAVMAHCTLQAGLADDAPSATPTGRSPFTVPAPSTLQ